MDAFQLPAGLAYARPRARSGGCPGADRGFAAGLRQLRARPRQDRSPERRLGASATGSDWFQPARPHPICDTDWARRCCTRATGMARLPNSSPPTPRRRTMPIAGDVGRSPDGQERSDLALTNSAKRRKTRPIGPAASEMGEALAYAGKPEAARQQFASAAALDLTANEKSELAHQH